jgi:hypothetical protein
MKITPEVLRNLRIEIDAALAALGAKHGLRLKAGSARYDANGLDATFKLEVTQGGADGAQAILDAARNEFAQMARLYGMQPDWFGKPFILNGYRFTVDGLAPGRHKNAVKIKRSDGKGFVCPPSTVISKLSVPSPVL